MLVREPLQVVEIRQPLCSREFGVSPCEATGVECFKTDFTCKFRAALDLTDEISLFFVSEDAHRPTDTGYDPSAAIPLLKAVRTAPTVLNVAAGNRDISPLGYRAVANIQIGDKAYNDAGIDPHVNERTHPLPGTLWGRWLKRNPFYVGYTVIVYDGFRGDALADMIKREYFISKIDRRSDSIVINTKDVLRKITDNDVKLPVQSSGVLASDIGTGESAFQVAGAVVADYPAPGWVRIGDEIISYATAQQAGTNVLLSGGARFQLNTTVDQHSQGDTVQWVLAYEDQPFQEILYDMCERTDVDAYIDKPDWDTEQEEWRPLYIFTGYISEPTKVSKLMSEVLTQAQSNIWWDERVQKIVLRAQRPNFFPSTISEVGQIVADSFSIKDESKERVTQVNAHYNLRSPVHDPDKIASYATSAVTIDVNRQVQYGEPAEKDIFCRWIDTRLLADAMSQSYLNRFKDVRQEVRFQMTAKDAEVYWTGDIAQIQHWMMQDQFGENLITQWIITSAETVEHGDLYQYTAEDNASAGFIWEWLADGNTDPTTEVGAWVDEDGTDGAGNVLPFGWI